MILEAVRPGMAIEEMVRRGRSADFGFWQAFTLSRVQFATPEKLQWAFQNLDHLSGFSRALAVTILIDGRLRSHEESKLSRIFQKMLHDIPLVADRAAIALGARGDKSGYVKAALLNATRSSDPTIAALAGVYFDQV